MNKQQIIQKLSYIATNLDDADVIRSNIFRFISEITQEGVTENQTYNARSFPVDVRQEIVLRDHFTCVYCNRVGSIDGDPDGSSWTVDHVVPWSKGGLTCIDNGVLSCRRCNSEKRAMTPAEYMKWLRFSDSPPVVDNVDGYGKRMVDAVAEMLQDVDTDGDADTDRCQIELTDELVNLYNGSNWHEFCQSLMSLYPDVSQSELRGVMSKVADRAANRFKGVAFEMFHRYSPNGDRSKFA